MLPKVTVHELKVSGNTVQPGDVLSIGQVLHISRNAYGSILAIVDDEGERRKQALGGNVLYDIKRPILEVP